MSVSCARVTRTTTRRPTCAGSQTGATWCARRTSRGTARPRRWTRTISCCSCSTRWRCTRPRPTQRLLPMPRPLSPLPLVVRPRRLRLTRCRPRRSTPPPRNLSSLIPHARRRIKLYHKRHINIDRF